ncbi:MAG: hypothetical protein JKY62_16700 [Desulfocapsa sp.]|nr:hypothetical protein [Desulfocapsa sp.]
MARDDSIGLFWEDHAAEKGRNRIAAIMPDIPETGWEPPKTLPNLSNSKVISLDVETWDPGLKDHGPGWSRGEGHLVGVSIGDDKGGCWYFPMRHEIEAEGNWDAEVILVWLRNTLCNPKQPKVGANIIYDIGWLWHEGVHVQGPLFDVQYAEALLNEAAPVALESLAQKYLGEGKESNLLYQWCSDYYGGPITGDQRKNIYRAPPRLVGPYAESDADLPLRIIAKQWPLLEKEGLMDLFIMECELIYLYLEMRFEGVTVNVPYAEELRDTLEKKEGEFQSELDRLAGFKVNTNSGEQLAKVFDSEGLTYNFTKPSKTYPQGKPSFTKDFIEAVNHPVGELIREIRLHAKLRGTFVESYILNSHVGGKVHGQFHPLRGETYGTRSGRYSSSNPNLQNIPSRHPILAPMIRGLFIPDIDHVAWRKYDYSQIEYRFMVHFAVGQAGQNARDMFNADPDLDYHNFAQKLVFDKTGMKIERKSIKKVNFGLIYGMGKKTLGAGLGLSKKQTAELFAAYFEAMDFAKPTMDAAMQEAQDTGVITTILGRKSRFDLWEPAGWTKKGFPLPIDQAILRYGNIKRAETHKALNRRLQGSSADQMKVALHKCYKDGIYDDIGVPRLIIHDESNHSDRGGCSEGFREMQYIFETAIPLKVPVKFGLDYGKDWGHAIECKDDKDLP